MAEKKKMGRPTDNFKGHKKTIRFDEKSVEIVNKYCKENNVNFAEAVRIAISKLK